MTREEFRVLVEEKGPVILDGGTGSCLRKMGMPVGVSTEQWVYEHPEEIARLQREYADAGSMAHLCPPFGTLLLSLGYRPSRSSTAGREAMSKRLDKQYINRLIFNHHSRTPRKSLT